ncbi:MAG: restriction endonuclease subunit S [Bacteroidales bacterium]|nr:restriction endonuclease subunit S [Bacteroidales bacterium]
MKKEKDSENKTRTFYIHEFPGGWEVKKFEDFAEIVMGQSPEGNTYNRTGEGLALINGPTEFTERHPIKIQWTSSPTKICKKGDVLLCVRGSSTGRTNIADDIYCIGRGIAAIRGKKNNDQSYLEFQVERIVNQILKLTTGSTFPNIDSKSLKSIKILLPPLPEQKAIARVLSTWDEAIHKTNQLIDQKELRKKWLMQQLLTGKKRLPAFGGEWKEVKISEAFAFIKSYSFSRDNLTYDNPDADIYCIHYGDIHAVFENDIVDLKREINVPLLKKEFSNVEFEFLKDGDVIIADASEDYEGVGESIELVNVGKKKIIGGLHTIVLRDKNKLTAKSYRAYLFNGETVLNSLRKVATGISVYGISKGNLAKIQVILPSIEEQTAIAGILQVADNEIQLLNKKLKELKEQKKGLMQVLLTGRKRLKQI